MASFLRLPRLTPITMGLVEVCYIPLRLNSASQKRCCAKFHSDSSGGFPINEKWSRRITALSMLRQDSFQR